MNLVELKKLLKLFEDSAISEMEVEQEGLRVRMRKGDTIQTVPATHYIQNAAPVMMSAPSVEPAAAEVALSKNHIVKSPMVGTFYRSPSPTSPPYVEEGDIVKVGSVLCIIEAMKLMNQIESDAAGKIVKIFPENGAPVEFGQPLFEIEAI